MKTGIMGTSVRGGMVARDHLSRVQYIIILTVKVLGCQYINKGVHMDYCMSGLGLASRLRLGLGLALGLEARCSLCRR